MKKPRQGLGMIARMVGCSVVLLLAVEARGAASPEPFQDGARWAVVGDSITHSGSYHTWIELFYLTRYPERAVEVLNCGISGDTAAGGLRRLEWDVLAKRPTVASVMFGMNDVGRQLYAADQNGAEIAQQRRARLQSYEENQRKLVTALQQAGVQVILLSPSIFDQTADLPAPKQTGVNDALAECTRLVERLARETGASYIDLHGPMDRLNRERQANDPSFTLVGPDRVHPGAPGHFVMAFHFLKAQGVASEVSRLTIDLTTGQYLAVNGTVDQFSRAPDSLSFSWTERALPFPAVPEIQSALRWVPFAEELNQQILQVAGLRPGRWELLIDGERVSVFTAAELAQGVNLSTEPATPQYRQALEVWTLVEARARLVSDNLRGIAHVEHQSAPDLPHPVTLEQMQPFLQRRLEAFQQNPPAASTRRSVELYPQRKVREDESIASARRMAELARLAVQPRTHIYSLRAVR